VTRTAKKDIDKIAEELSLKLSSNNLFARKFLVEALEALEALGANGSAAVPALIKALDDEDRDGRRVAARVLGEIGPAAKDALPALQKLLHESEDLKVQRSAKEAIERIQQD